MLIKDNNKVFIQTITHYYVGEITEVYNLGTKTFVRLEKAAWVADTGKLSTFLSEGKPNEYEVIPDGVVEINTDSIVAMTAWTTELLTPD